MSTFTNDGASLDAYADLASTIEDLLQTAFGDNITTAADGVFGHIKDLQSLAMAEQNEIAEYVKDAMNPQAAGGTALSSLVLLNGIQRQEAEYSTVTLTCTSNAAGCTIPAGSLASDPSSNYQWATDAQLVVAPSSSDTVSATCTVDGAVSAVADTITQIDTPVYGWASVNNASAATEGQTEEADGTLRARRTTVAERASSTSTSAQYGAISDVTGVTDCLVRENTSGSTDAYGVPDGYTWAVVLGGADNDIAEAIAIHHGGGIGTYGSSSGIYDNPTSGLLETYYFDRPTDVDIYVAVNVSTDGDYPADGDDDISDAIIAYFGTLGLGEDVKHSRLYTPVNTVDGHTIDSLYVGTTSGPTGTSDISIAPNQRAVITAARITVNS